MVTAKHRDLRESQLRQFLFLLDTYVLNMVGRLFPFLREITNVTEGECEKSKSKVRIKSFLKVFLNLLQEYVKYLINAVLITQLNRVGYTVYAIG